MNTSTDTPKKPKPPSSKSVPTNSPSASKTMPAHTKESAPMNTKPHLPKKPKPHRPKKPSTSHDFPAQPSAQVLETVSLDDLAIRVLGKPIFDAIQEMTLSDDAQLIARKDGIITIFARATDKAVAAAVVGIVTFLISAGMFLVVNSGPIKVFAASIVVPGK